MNLFPWFFMILLLNQIHSQIISYRTFQFPRHRKLSSILEFMAFANICPKHGISMILLLVLIRIQDVCLSLFLAAMKIFDFDVCNALEYILIIVKRIVLALLFSSTAIYSQKNKLRYNNVLARFIQADIKKDCTAVNKSKLSRTDTKYKNRMGKRRHCALEELNRRYAALVFRGCTFRQIYSLLGSLTAKTLRLNLKLVLLNAFNLVLLPFGTVILITVFLFHLTRSFTNKVRTSLYRMMRRS